ncbi:MAG: HEAT repeat domain-containing protein [Planctomycetota bacterium]|nr:MAG: HEAT repeat domain-containing protein [Planctomycetota bacterium]
MSFNYKGGICSRWIGVWITISSLLSVVVISGCATTTPDPKLRDLATRYIRAACRFADNSAVRAQALEAAAEVMVSDPGLLVREGLSDEHPGVRFAACMALGRLRNTGSISTIRKLVNDSDHSVRIGAYYALERLGDSSFRSKWSEALAKHPDAAVRRNAAFAMGQLEDKAILPLLHRAVANDEDEGVRLQALEAMVGLGDKNAIDQFFVYAFGGVDYKQPFSLLALAYAAKDCQDIALRARLEGALFARLSHATYLESRLAAARGLGMLGYKQGFDLALKSLTWNKARSNLSDDPPENQLMRVRSMAAMALGEIGDPRALEPLKKRMETPDDPRIQLAAATAIAKILNKTPF